MLRRSCSIIGDLRLSCWRDHPPCCCGCVRRSAGQRGSDREPVPFATSGTATGSARAALAMQGNWRCAGPASGRFLRFRYMGRNRVHQWWRQAIIGLESEFLQTPAYAVHVFRLHAGLDDGRYERRESWCCPTTFLEQLGVDEIQAVEGMARVLDAAVHMRAAGLAGVALDHRGPVDDLEFVAVFEHGHVLPRHDGDDGEVRTLGLPAFGAAASVVVGDIALDPDLDRFVLAFADQGATGKAARASLHAAINHGVDVSRHGSILLVHKSLDPADGAVRRSPCRPDDTPRQALWRSDAGRSDAAR